jgi:glycosyltransferase involved in cell wall biosynthesis
MNSVTDSQKHVLVVTQYFWPENFRVNDLVEGLTERGLRVTVLTGLPNYPQGSFFRGYGILKGPYTESFKNNVRIVRIPIIPRGTKKGLQLFLNYLSFVVVGCFFVIFRCREKYHSIFVYEVSPITVVIPALVLRWLKRIPVVFWVTDLWPESLRATRIVTSKLILQAVALMVRVLYKFCDHILVSGKGFINRVNALGVSFDKIEYFPQWAESFFSKNVHIDDGIIAKKEFPQGFCILFAGNIGTAQSFETLLEAAKKLKTHPNIHWVILGDGQQRNWVANAVKEHGLDNVFHLLGSRSFESMPTYYSMADVLLVSLRPDPVFAITVPGKLQTYMASNKPIIGSLDGEGADLIRAAQCGICAPAGDAEQLAQAVIKLYEMSPNERELMGHNGRKYFEEHFEREKAIDRLKTLLQNAAYNTRPTERRN